MTDSVLTNDTDRASEAASGAESTDMDDASTAALSCAEQSDLTALEAVLDDAARFHAASDSVEPPDVLSGIAELPAVEKETVEHGPDGFAVTLPPFEAVNQTFPSAINEADLADAELISDALPQAASEPALSEGKPQEDDAPSSGGMPEEPGASERSAEVVAAVVIAPMRVDVVAPTYAVVPDSVEPVMVDGAAVVLEDDAAHDPNDAVVVALEAPSLDEMVSAHAVVNESSHDVAPRTDGVETSMSLSDAMPSAPRRNRRPSKEDRAREQIVPTVPGAADVEPTNEMVPDDADASDVLSLGAGVALASTTECDDASWRDHWPDNEVQIVGRLLPRATDAPTIDGVLRVRMEVALVEQYDGEFGSIGNLPIFILPDAPGFGPIYRDVMRASRYNPRAQPMMVELRGILRQLIDRDPRYATERFTVLMGVEVHRVSRAAPNAEQYAFWRGRATVRYVNSYKHKGQPYRRVNAVVSHKQRKPRLRGVSVMHIPVDFLVALEHEHADRFGRVEQPLLIEANIASDVYRIKDTHPSLEGLEPERKSQLQVQRDAIVTVTLGEFPDAKAEQDYTRWVKAGRPFPQRPVREPRAVTAAASPHESAAQSAVASRSSDRGGDVHPLGRDDAAARKATPPNPQRTANQTMPIASQRATGKKQSRAMERTQLASASVRDGTG